MTIRKGGTRTPVLSPTMNKTRQRNREIRQAKNREYGKK